MIVAAKSERERMCWWPWAVLLGLLVALSGLPGIGLADDDNDKKKKQKDKQETSEQSTAAAADARPDLEITFEGFNAPGVNDQLINFKVTNLGKGQSTAIKARVVTLEPEPTPWQRDLDVLSLAPGASVEIFYPLSASCNGHLVRASVNDPLDFPSVNDRVEARVCPARSASAPSSLTGPPGVDTSAVVTQEGFEDVFTDRNRNFPGDLFPTETSDNISDADKARVGERVSRPELLRVGRHTITRQPVAVRRLWERYAGQGSASGPLAECINYRRPGADADPNNMMVGYEHVSGGCTSGVVYQTAFKFDFSDLYQFTSTASAGALEVVRADLAWENEPGTHRSTDGQPGGDRSCIGEIGILFPGPQHNLGDQQGLITHYPLYQGVIYISHEVDKLRVNRMIHYPTDNNGFLLRGSDESLSKADNGACVSLVSNFSLSFTYDVSD